MAMWYYSSEGKAKGPLSEEEMIRSIREGRLALKDLVFGEGETEWKPASDVEAFSDVQVQEQPHAQSFESSQASAAFIAPPFPQSAFQPSDLEVVWVVLRRRDDVFHQSGPYSIPQILNSIGTGEIHYTDHVWKPGFAEWIRIGQMPEFDRRRRQLSTENLPVPKVEDVFSTVSREMESDFQLNTVIHYQRAPVSRETAPPQTNGIDLVSGEQLANAEPAQESVSPKTDSVTSESFLADSALEATRIAPVSEGAVSPRSVSPSSRSHVRRKLFAASVAAGLVLALGAHFVSHRPVDEAASAPEKTTARAAIKAAAASGASTTAPAAEKNHVPVEEKTTPVEYRIVGLKLTNDDPSLVIQGGYALNAKIHVTLTAPVGAIIGRPNYANAFDIQRHEGEIPSVSLTPLNLPPGRYNVQVESSGVPAQTATIFVGPYAGGATDPAFVQAHEHYLKTIAAESQSERHTMFYASAEFEKLTRNLTAGYGKFRHDPKRWHAFYDGWRKAARTAELPLASYKHRPKTELIYFGEMTALQLSENRLLTHASSLNTAVTQKRDVASTSPVSSDDFKTLRQRISALSTRPQ